MKLFTKLFASLTLIFTFNSAFAQESAPAISNDIEEIVVTARAGEASIRDIPVAITAYSEEEMENLNINSLDDLAATSASLEINRINSGSGVQIAIRGIASSPGSIGIEQSVAVMIDNVYFPQGRVINEGLFDTQQVAILKGPQALYFGKNATAGAVSIVTNDPTDEFEVSLSLGHEFEYKTDTYEFVISGPISDKWGARLALYESNMDEGWIQNVAGDSTYTTNDAANGFASTVHQNPAPTQKYYPATEESFARLTLKGELTERTTLTLKASMAETFVASATVAELFSCYLGDTPQINTGGVANPNPLGGDCNKDRRTGLNNIPPAFANDYDTAGVFGGALGDQYESKIYTAKLEHDFDSSQLTAIFNMHEQDVAWVIDADYNAATNVFAGEMNEFENTSMELKWVSTDAGSLNWALGAYWQETERYFIQEVMFAGAENSAADPSNRYVAYDKLS